MIIRLFKTNQVTGLVFLLIFQVLIYLNAFLHRLTLIDRPIHSALFEQIPWLPITYPWLSALISFIFVLLQALWFNYFIYSVNILGRLTYLPAFFYILIATVFPENLYLSPGLLANFFLLAGMMGLWQIAHTKQLPRPVFFTAIVFSLASLIYSPVLILLPWFFLALFTFARSQFRIVLVGLIGWFLPYFYTSIAYLFFTDISVFFHDFFIVPFGLPDYRLDLGIIEYMICVWLFGLFIASFYHYLHTTHFYKVVQKRSLRIWGMMLLLLVISAAFYNYLQLSHILLLSFPLATFFSTYFLHIKKYWVADLLTIFIISCLFVLQFSYF